MIKLNELYITPNGKKLGLNVQIENKEYYSDVGIDIIALDTSNSYSEQGPSSKAIILFKAKDTEETLIKEYNKLIDISDLGDNLYFVHVITKGEPAANTPCGTIIKHKIYPVYNKALLYGRSLNLLNSIVDCELPLNLINEILKLKAFELSLKLGQYPTAINYWNTFFNKKACKPLTPCNCNGK